MSAFEPYPVDLTVYGKPRGKGRPRFTRAGGGRTFTDAQTAQAEKDVRSVWELAGCPYLEAGPIEVLVDAAIERPAAHFTTKGLQSTKARREPYPCKTPDVDNVWKLAADALNGKAFPDDKYVVRAAITKRWCRVGERPHVRIRARHLDPAQRPAYQGGRMNPMTPDEHGERS
jgi:Holliday junction resolvase RusA-like endonuclease